ncbi:sensor histidine kinase [Paenibacillus sp. J5C_2022]|nr:sensor histidine kinase [Paenibacillus sp. J5C2022]
MSLSVASDQEIQQFLGIIRRTPGSYEAIVAEDMLVNKLMSYPTSKPYIESMAILTNHKQYSAGMNVLKYSDKETANLIRLASDKKGGDSWAQSLDSSGALNFARQVLEIEGLSLNALGSVVIRVSMDKLLSAARFQISNYNSRLLLFSGDNLLYPIRSGGDFTEVTSVSPGRQAGGYQIVTVEGSKYLRTFAEFPPAGWTFVHLIPYDKLFSDIVRMKILIILLHILMFAFIMYIGIRLARSITTPIETLTRKIEAAGKGYFEAGKDAGPMNRDEIGLLNRDFNKMTDKLDALIKENYLKQIVLKETEYQALRAKINPHFLYNTFESINWLAIMNGQEQISRMIKALGDLLRCSISAEESITLREELANLQHYVTIQKFRFQDKLVYRQDIDETFHQLSLPSFVLQPLVENSIIHGVEESSGECIVTVTAEHYGDRLKLGVHDTGPGMDEIMLEKLHRGEAVNTGTGVGLINIDSRIKMMFGEKFGIRIGKPSSGHGVSVFIELPYKKELKKNVQNLDCG